MPRPKTDMSDHWVFIDDRSRIDITGVVTHFFPFILWIGLVLNDFRLVVKITSLSRNKG